MTTQTVTIAADKYDLAKAAEMIRNALVNFRHCANMADRSEDRNRELAQANRIETIANALFKPVTP